MERIRSYDDDGAYRAHKSVGVAQSPALRAGQIVNWAGALVSLGLVLGMVVWAFQLAVRDVSGVPVIRALEGPMRSAPVDPGGVQADHMGLAVNLLAEGAEAGQVPDRLVLAPPPVELVPLELSSASLATDATEQEAASPTPETVSAQTHELIERLIARNEPALADPEAPAPEIAPAQIAPAETLAEPQGETQTIPASVAGVAQSLRPMTRPGSIAAPATQTQASASASVVVELDPASLPEGTRLAQLGAFDTPEIAQAEWERLVTRFPDYFTGRLRVIQEASSGGSAFFRLRAHGFEDLAASRRFCEALMAQNAPCIPVTVR